MTSVDRIFRILREAVAVAEHDKHRAMVARALIETAQLMTEERKDQ